MNRSGCTPLPRVRQPPSKRQRYTRNACDQCKRRKVKCSGEPSCRQCLRQGYQCTYSYLSSLEEPNTPYSFRSLESRLSQLQASLDEALEHVKVSGHPVASAGLQDLTRQIAQQIETCKTGSQFHPQIKATRPDSPAKAVSGGDGVRIAQLQLTSSCNIASPQNSESITNDIHQTTQSQAQIALLPLSKIQTFELLDYFRYEVESIYSFIQLDCLTSLADVLLDSSTTTSDSSMNMQTEEWGDTFDGRNLDLLMLLLACALTSKLNRECEVSHEMTNIVREKLSIKMRGSEFDLKDIAVTTLLSIYHHQCDDTTLAWRTIGTAAKMCMELGLHKSTSTKVSWAPKLFWCIYILDRRYSFMINLPFTLHDSDIDCKPPIPDRSDPYLSPLIKYIRLATRIVTGLPKFGSNSSFIDQSACASLDIEINQWALDTSTEFSRCETRPLGPSRTSQKIRLQEVFIAVCRNQLKIALYKCNLFSPENIARNPNFAYSAVSYAVDTLQVFSRLERTTSIYELQAAHYNFFVLSALAVVYLAVRHAPLQFSSASQMFFTGIQILKAHSTSERLCERIQALNNAMTKLGFKFLDIDPEGHSQPTDTDESNAIELWDGSQERDSRSLDLSSWIPEYGLLSSFLPQSLHTTQPDIEHQVQNSCITQESRNPYDDQFWLYSNPQNILNTVPNSFL
ncbi:hypothetical protein VE04_05796 [Pseudogymnoascus sp. 24MN13]|nr:hypothetical protein VE04_05796 [Pseudogymnoascus sp. 24MN13]